MLALAVLALAGIVVGPMPAWAMSVGDVAVLSSLNEPLDAHVPIARTQSDPEIEAIRLAPPRAYDEAGLQAPGVRLDTLQLTWESTQGGVVMRLRSSVAIAEPTLTLLLDLRTVRGVQRYALDLLIDSTAARGGAATRNRYGPVRAGETLSGIAESLALRRGSSLNLMLAAIKRLNPQAFGGSVHTLLQGAILQIPSDQDLAVQQRLHQTVRWYRDPGVRPPRALSRVSSSGDTWWWRSVDGKPAVLYVSDLMFPLEIGFWSYQALAEAHFRALHDTESREPWLFQLDWTLESLPVPIDPETAMDTLYAQGSDGLLTEQGGSADFAPPVPRPNDAPSITRALDLGSRAGWPVTVLQGLAAFIAGLVLVALVLTGVHGRWLRRSVR